MPEQVPPTHANDQVTARVTVARAGELAPGQIKPVEAGGVPMILYRVGDRYYAAQRHCIHQRADLAHGSIQEDGFLTCPRHGWRFHAATGRHELSPETCLRTYAVTVEGGEIAIDPTPMWQGEIIP